MNRLHHLVLVCSILLLSACQTVPLLERERNTFGEPEDGRGIVRITGFPVPKDEPGITFLLILAAAGGADINYPVYASVYDVTDQTRYLGTMPVYSFGGWLEMEAAPGKRRLMLTLAGGSGIYAGGLGPHTDFIEIEVKSGEISHVALSRHGFARYPYLHEITISPEHREHCLAMRGTPKERMAQTEQYMADNGINPYTRDFKAFCLLLAGQKDVLKPTAEALKQFDAQRKVIEQVRNEQYGKWLAGGVATARYDLMRIYEPVTQQAQ